MAYPGRWRESAARVSADLQAGNASRAPAFSRVLGVGRNAVAGVLERIPSACPLCRGAALGGALCAGCHDDVVASMQSSSGRCGVCRLALDEHAGCPDCACQPPAFDRVVAAFDYTLPGDFLIRQFKAGRRFSHARFLAAMLARAVVEDGQQLAQDTILVPVPASRASIMQRGFNPAAEIARYLAPRLSLSCRPGLLVRHHEGGRQTHLPRVQRMRQASGLYTCTASVDGATIAVVDDVLTTGSTLHGIALQLKAAGAVAVWGLVLARTPYR